MGLRARVCASPPTAPRAKAIPDSMRPSDTVPADGKFGAFLSEVAARLGDLGDKAKVGDTAASALQGRVAKLEQHELLQENSVNCALHCQPGQYVDEMCR